MPTIVPWLAEAQKNIGVKEVPGEGNNPRIIAWAKRIGGWIASFYKKDSIPWCGLFVNHCMGVAGMAMLQSGLSALAWLKYGVPLKIAVPGAIMVFKRTGGGHVGFYVSEDNEAYHILGGNQSDAVSIARVAKNRLVGIRWPANYKVPEDLRPVVKKFDGKLSTNEA